MKHLSLNLNQRRRAIGVLLVTTFLAITALVQPVSAQAQDDWAWRGTIYGWLPSIEGSTVFPTGGEGGGGDSGITVDADQILSSLDFTFMGVLKGRKGSWGMYTDVLYLDVGGSEKGSRDFTVGPGDLPAGIDAKINMDLKSWVWSIAGTYNLVANSKHESDVLLGARMVDMSQTLGYHINGDIGGLPLPERSGSTKVTATNWDAIIGITGHVMVGDSSNWFVPYYFDVGTGDSDLTLQAMAGVGYKFGWGAMELTYRYLDYDPGSDSPIEDLNFAGPLFGATFQW